MDFGADIVGDQAHDALAIGRREPLASVGEASERRSTQRRPSVLSITSTTLASPRKSAMAGPRAVRSMRAPRSIASDFSEEAATLSPFFLRDRVRQSLDRG
jgi:hypothetical protein